MVALTHGLFLGSHFKLSIRYSLCRIPHRLGAWLKLGFLRGGIVVHGIQTPKGSAKP
jgi:hypothetical protein